MRLICPNCDAQYEVDASAIPPEGRDVQCSNCGNAWFQDAEPVAEVSADPAFAMGAADTVFAQNEMPDPQTDAPTGGTDTPATHDTPAPTVTATSYDDDDDEEDASPPPTAALTQRSVDESVLSVLREEAELEAGARRAEAAGIEMQGDLGLPPPVSVGVGAAAAAAASAQARTDPHVTTSKGEPVAPSRPAARRDLLPDIEEINSTLSPSSEEGAEPVDVDSLPDLTGGAKGRSGFRSGFVLMLLLAGLGTALYIMAPQISQQIPGAADAMAAYVAGVDAARIWLDGLIRQATGALNGFTGNSG